MKPTQRLMTREEFENFAAGHPGEHGGNGPLHLFVRPPYHAIPCRCGDINCHGWRFVELRPSRPFPELAYELGA